MKINKPEIELVEITSLKHYQFNNKKHPPNQIQVLKESIQTNGFNNPIIIDEHNEIINGHGRVIACRELKLTIIPAIRLTDLSEEQKRAYRIADNKIAELAPWDLDNLRHELQELQDLDIDITLTAFELDEIDRILEVEEDNTEEIVVTPKPKMAKVVIDCLEGDVEDIKDSITFLLEQKQFKQFEVNIRL